MQDTWDQFWEVLMPDTVLTPLSRVTDTRSENFTVTISFNSEVSNSVRGICTFSKACWAVRINFSWKCLSLFTSGYRNFRQEEARREEPSL